MANIPLTSKQIALEAAELLVQHINGLQPRWLVELDKATVVKASLGVEPSLEYKAGKGTYFVRAQDELEAFMKARKMEEEGEGRCWP
jgi:hypothetical protein